MCSALSRKRQRSFCIEFLLHEVRGLCSHSLASNSFRVQFFNTCGCTAVLSTWLRNDVSECQMCRYTSFSGLYPLLSSSTLPLVKVEEISQTIDSENFTVQNCVKFAGPLATTSLSTNAKFEVRSPKRVQVSLCILLTIGEPMASCCNGEFLRLENGEFLRTLRPTMTWGPHSA